MRRFVRVCLLPVTVAVLAWALVGALPRPAEVVAQTRQVPTLEAADSSGNGHDGMIQGRVRLGLPGHDGSAYSFAARGSWIRVPSTPALNPGPDAFLLSAWVNLTEAPGGTETFDVIRKGVGFTRSGEFKLEVMGTGQIRCSAKDASRNLVKVFSENAVVDGTWHWVGCARAGRAWLALVDDDVTSELDELGAVRNTVALSIGSKYGMEDRPAGRIDDVELRIDRNADTSAEDVRIDALKKLPPVASWRLDEPTHVARP